MVDLSIVPLNGVKLTVIPPDHTPISRGRIRIENTGETLRAWRRRDLVAEGTPVSVERINAKLIEVTMNDGTLWLARSCGCGG